MNKWIRVTESTMPPENLIVETKIDDVHGVRNEAKLKLCKKLWWLADGSMYVYYVPTHWKYIRDSW